MALEFKHLQCANLFKFVCPLSYNNTFKSVGAGLALLVTLSLANTLGGYTQWAILLAFGMPSVVGLRSAPVVLGLILSVGALIIVFSTIMNQTPPLLALQVIRPFLEGGVAGIVVFRLFGMSTWRQFASALAVYIVAQAALATLMTLYPDFKANLMDAIYSHRTYDIAAFRDAVDFRAFGISRHHLYGLPLAAGLCLIVLSAIADEEKEWPNFFFVSACLSVPIILMNARTGLLAPALAIASGLVFVKFRRYLSVVALACFGLAFIFGLPVAMGERGVLLQHWLIGGAMQFLEPHYTNNSAIGPTTMSDLASMVHIPDTWQALAFGLGQVCVQLSDCYSDIGYIRLLQIGGVGLLIVMAVVTVLIVVEVWRSTRTMQLANRIVLACGVVSSITLALLKGDAYFSSDFSRLLYAIFFMAFFINQSYLSKQSETSTRADRFKIWRGGHTEIQSKTA